MFVRENDRRAAEAAAKKAEEAQKEADEAARVAAAHAPIEETQEGRSVPGASAKATQQAPAAHPKPFDPAATPSRAMLDVLRHDDSAAALKGPATAKAAKTQEVQKERQGGGAKGSDSHRKFLPAWQKDRPWLAFRKVEEPDLENVGEMLLVTAMFCTLCEEAGLDHHATGKVNVWTRAGGGCQRAKVQSVKEHEESEVHKAAVNLPINQGDMKQAVKTAILQDEVVLLNLATIVYSMAKNNDSIRSYPQRCKAAEMLTVEVKTRGEDGRVTRETHNVDLGPGAYLSEEFARQMLYFMDDEIRSGIIEDFHGSRFHSAILDEATAKTRKQHVVQYISYWKNGRVQRKYWNIVGIKAQDAKSIYEADLGSLVQLTGGDEEVYHKGHMCKGGDGASVISGGLTGVAARYREHNPRLKFNHCACHKSSLSAADGAAGVPELAVFDSQVKGFYNFFGSSVERRTAHSAVQARMHETVRHLRKGIVTRWLSVGEALESLDMSLVSLYIMFCEFAKEEVSSGFIAALQQHKFIVLVKGMRDILSKLNLLNVVMQTQGLTFTTIKVHVNSTKAGLKREWIDRSAPQHPMFVSEALVTGGDSFKGLVTQMKSGVLEEGGSFKYELVSVGPVKRKIGGEGEPEKPEDHKIQIQGSCEEHLEAVELLSSFAEGVRESLTARFADVNDLALFDVLHPSRVPKLDDADFGEFGVQQIQRLIDIYGVDIEKDGLLYPALISPEQTKHEFAVYKMLVWELGWAGKGKADEDAFEALLTDQHLSKTLPNMAILIEIEGVQWLESATAERGFSLRTQILTAQRYSMGDSLLSCLMMIISNGPALDQKEEVEKLLLGAIARFKAFKRRMPSRSFTGKRPRASSGAAPSSVLAQLSGLDNVVWSASNAAVHTCHSFIACETAI